MEDWKTIKPKSPRPPKDDESDASSHFSCGCDYHLVSLYINRDFPYRKEYNRPISKMYNLQTSRHYGPYGSKPNHQSNRDIKYSHKQHRAQMNRFMKYHLNDYEYLYETSIAHSKQFRRQRKPNYLVHKLNNIYNDMKV